MESLAQTFTEALRLLLSGGPDLWSIIGVSFSVSLRALGFTAPLALGLALTLTLGRVWGGRWVLSLCNALLALPTVLIGLLLYLLLTRQGPLGDLRLLFTQKAMMLAQMVLCFPLLVSLMHSTLRSAHRQTWETARMLGASPLRASGTLILEVRFGLLTALVAGFGRVISEVGGSMMLGGNILYHTRNMTTAIALETSKGEFAQGIALGLLLLGLSLLINLALGHLQGVERAWT